MDKISLKDFRFLHDNFLDTGNKLLLLLSAGNHFIEVDQDTFASSTGYYYINREVIRTAWQQRGLDTRSWSYWTNEYGKLLI